MCESSVASGRRHLPLPWQCGCRCAAILSNQNPFSIPPSRSFSFLLLSRLHLVSGVATSECQHLPVPDLAISSQFVSAFLRSLVEFFNSIQVVQFFGEIKNSEEGKMERKVWGVSVPCALVEQLNEKLTIVGEEAVDATRIRPMRRRSEPPSSLPKIVVEANHFPVTFDMNTFPRKVYHYDVVITPKEPKDKEGNLVEDPKETTIPDRLLHLIWREFEDKYHKKLGARMPFDGKKNCYTAKPLNLGSNSSWNTEIVMTDPDDDDKKRTYRIALQFTNDVSTESMFNYLRSCESWKRCELPQEVIQALDVALRYCPSLHYTPCNRSFYSERGPHNLSELLELWFGHNQSLLLGRDKMATLNVDMANKAFIKRLPVSRLIKMLLNQNDDSKLNGGILSTDLKKLEDFLKGKLIEYGTDPGVNGKFERRHRYTAVRVTEYNSQYSFPSNGKSTTIQAYFEREKGVRLVHPNWPVVHVGNKNMTNYVPLELCHVVPQAFKGKLTPADTSEMIKGAAKPPADRFRRIQNSRDNCGFERCPILKEFGMSVGKKMLTINSAVKLPKPQLNLRNEQGKEEHMEPKQDGKFQIGRFLRGAVVPKIGVLNASGRTNRNFERELLPFLRMLGEEARKMGMLAAAPDQSLAPTHFSDAKIETVFAKPIRGAMNADVLFVKQVNERLKTLKEAECRLVLVIIGRDGIEYPTIKSEAEVRVGVLTQCVKVSTVDKMLNPRGGKQVAINLLLKINAKLNGLNFKLGDKVYKDFRFKDEPILILGADVTHPAPHSKAPSVAAITASYDLAGMAYQMHIQVQPRRQEGAAEEVIDGLQDRVKEMLLRYFVTNKTQPSRIIMFRDGVSEGQFPQIKEKEYGAIVAACHSLGQRGTYNPNITFLVVKKRHHTRFRPMNAADGCPPKGNIPPGTCVDTMITHPTEMEYFLNSHVGIQGTSKPTRYHVIHDDNNFTMLELERLTYCLCYTFVRCTAPVSYPAPTYYAHLAAFRARALLENEGENADLSVLEEKLTINPQLKNMYPMFYV